MAKDVVSVAVEDFAVIGSSNNAYEAKVVLSDGRTGEGLSRNFFSSRNNHQEAISNAILDANSKPVPKK